MIIAPPLSAELPVIVEAEIVREPKLLKAPPLPEVKTAPDTVIPETNKLPPVAILKKLKPLVLPLMVSEEAPRPLMVTLPAEDALAMVGSTEASVIVFDPIKLKLMPSLPGVLLAWVIASLKEVTPSVAVASEVVLTAIPKE